MAIEWSEESNFSVFASRFVSERGAEAGTAMQEVSDAETIFLLPEGITHNQARELLLTHPETCWAPERFARAALVVRAYRKALQAEVAGMDFTPSEIAPDDLLVPESMETQAPEEKYEEAALQTPEQQPPTLEVLKKGAIRRLIGAAGGYSEYVRKSLMRKQVDYPETNHARLAKQLKGGGLFTDPEYGRRFGLSQEEAARLGQFLGLRRHRNNRGEYTLEEATAQPLQLLRQRAKAGGKNPDDVERDLLTAISKAFPEVSNEQLAEIRKNEHHLAIAVAARLDRTLNVVGSAGVLGVDDSIPQETVRRITLKLKASLLHTRQLAPNRKTVTAEFWQLLQLSDTEARVLAMLTGIGIKSNGSEYTLVNAPPVSLGGIRERFRQKGVGGDPSQIAAEALRKFCNYHDTKGQGNPKY